MVSFLFWNMNKKPLLNRVVRLVKHHEIDVLILAECSIDPPEILDGLNLVGPSRYVLPTSENRKIRIFTRAPVTSLTDVFRDINERIIIRRLKIADAPELLLVAAHLPSRRNWSRDDQTSYSSTVARPIIQEEDKSGRKPSAEFS